MTAQKNKLAYIYFILVAAFWGISVPVIKATSLTVPPLSFLAIRFAIATIVSFPFIIQIFRKYRFNKMRIKYILTASILEPVLAISLIFIGISLTTSVESSVMTAFSPLIVSIFGYIFLHEIITKKQIEGTLIAFVGILTIILGPMFTNVGGAQNSELHLLGNIIILVAIVSDAGYIIYSKKYISPDKIINPQIIILLSFIIGTIFFIPAGLIEQYSMFKIEHKDNIQNTCTRTDINNADYNDNVACDLTGCFEIQHKPVYEKAPKLGAKVGEDIREDIDLTKRDYYCLITAQTKTFKETIMENLKLYIKYPTILGILYMSIISGLVSYILYQKGLEKIEASEAGLFTYLQPVFGIPFAILMLKEKISTVFLIGMILIIIGVFYAEKNGHNKNNKD